MANNILSAIRNIVDFGSTDLKGYATKYLIRINAVGEQLEFYVQDAIANTFTLDSEKKNLIYESVFSYLGNQNNPPDMIIKKGDAFEVKKIESPKSSLALNSSPPKDKLHSNDKRITESCRNCEVGGWKEKDLFYVLGYTKTSKLKYLLFVQGTCYAANSKIYAKVNDSLKKGVDSVLDSLGLEKGRTVELGRVNKVDPLGITELRIRGMWQIRNPLRVYDFLKIDNQDKFHLFAIMKKEKYESFPKQDRLNLERSKEILIETVKIKDPNNPAKLMDAKLISYKEK